MILAKIDGHEKRMANESSLAQNLSNLLANTNGISPDYNLHERFGSQYVQFLQETRGRPRREEFMTKGAFSLDCFSFEMISSINESSPYPQPENVRRLEAFWKEYLFERK